MSLYNNVEKLILQKTGSGGRKSSPNNLVDNAVGGLGMGAFGTAAAGIAGNMAKNAGVSAAERLANKYIPAEVQKGLSIAGGMVSDYMQDGEDGGLGGVGLGLLDSGMFNNLLPGMSSVASQAKYWKRKIPLWGGITPTRAAEIYDQMMSQKLAKKNLFLVEVSSPPYGAGISDLFNLFVTELDYAPLTITGEKRRVGAANFDSVQSAEPVELRITTMDDQYGSIKKWYANHHGMVAAEDGTVGVPASYAIKFRIIHSFIDHSQLKVSYSKFETDKNGNVTSGGNEVRGYGNGHYEDIGLYRPANLEVSLSRREDGLQEIQMVFSQLDTFMKSS